MPENLNADEILTIAEQIERDGYAFYRAAAERAENERERKLFADLAEWEKEHERVFTAMHEAVARDPEKARTLDPQSEEALYLHAIHEGRIFDLTTPPEEVVARCRNTVDIIRDAVMREKDTVIFYMALGAMMRTREDEDRLNTVITEELSHVRFLSDLLASLT